MAQAVPWRDVGKMFERMASAASLAAEKIGSRALDA